MIIRLKAVYAASAGVVEVITDRDGIFLRILDGDALIQRNKNIRGARHYGFDLRFAQLAIESLGYIEVGDFFGASETPICPVIFPAMPRVHNYSCKGLACIFRRFWRGRASS